MASHPYETGWNPPAPFIAVTLRSPDGTGPDESLRLLADSGADQTVIPIGIVVRLGLISLGRVSVGGFTGQMYLDEYEVQLSIDNEPPLNLPVLAALQGQHVMIGRDVLNRYRTVLDGPNQRLEIG